jgi:hypothetical protein
MHVAAAGAGVVCLGLLAAYLVGVVSSQPTLEGAVSAAGFVAIAGTGILYAWRLGAGGTLD